METLTLTVMETFLPYGQHSNGPTLEGVSHTLRDESGGGIHNI